MSEIISKTYNLIDTLENSNLIKELTIAKEKLSKNKRILSLIKEYQQTTNNKKLIKLKKEILKDKDYKIYQKSYNELFYIVLKINSKYQEYTNTKEYHE